MGSSTHSTLLRQLVESLINFSANASMYISFILGMHEFRICISNEAWAYFYFCHCVIVFFVVTHTAWKDAMRVIRCFAMGLTLSQLYVIQSRGLERLVY